MIHPHTELRFISPEIGWGVFATKPIPKGTVTWVRDELDHILSPARVRALGPLYREHLEKYTYRDKAGNYILCWDQARFMNHSCAPTCRGTDLGFEIAVRDLLPGDEMTDDYAELHLQPEESFRCYCGTSQCRGLITAADVVVYEEQWQLELADALRFFDKVAQPLGSLVRFSR
jgi:SET domain-containing protein